MPAASVRATSDTIVVQTKAEIVRSALLVNSGTVKVHLAHFAQLAHIPLAWPPQRQARA